LHAVPPFPHDPPMSRSIVTRSGDAGLTGLLYGQRVPKDHPQIEAVGAFDEFNAQLGQAKSCHSDAAVRAELERIQHELVALMGELACAEEDAARYEASKFPRLEAASLDRIDAAVKELEGRGLTFDGWATPGANPSAAALDVARAVARRAERRLHALSTHGRTVRPLVASYVNRVADLLWLLARAAENEPKA
jgi:cob(I)alamin adenosyltransferase